MKYLKYYKQINETLKSDEIEIVTKKLSNFFDKLGFNRKNDFIDKVKSPYYQIVSDRNYMKKTLNDYISNKDKWEKNIIEYNKEYNTDLKLSSLIDDCENSLNNFKYGDICIFTDKNNPQISQDLLHLIKTCGYFVASYGNEKSEINFNDKGLSLFIEPYYDTQVKFDGEYLYHSTKKSALEKILKVGLIPKTKNTRSFYPKRIYLSPNKEYNDSIISQLNTDKPGDYVTLKIKNFDGLKLYKDVRFKGGFYTYTNIHPKYIEVYEN